jgi:hypothetical protein
LETKITEKEVKSFFDIFRDEEYSKEMLDAGEAEFIRSDLLPYSIEHYLNIVNEGHDHHECGSCDE